MSEEREVRAEGEEQDVEETDVEAHKKAVRYGDETTPSGDDDVEAHVKGGRNS